MKKKMLVIGLIMSISMTFTGCFAGIENEKAKQGSLFSTNKGDYIVVNYAGNKIVDVWKLKNAYVKSEDSSDGWNFVDSKGNAVMLSGDVKVQRINDADTFDNYREYHYEYNGGDYYDFVKNSK